MPLLEAAASLLLAGMFLPGLMTDPIEGAGPSYRYRRAFTWPDGWIATELLSASSLELAARTLSIPMCPKWLCALETGLQKFVLLTMDGGPSDRAVLCVFDQIGSVWSLAEAFGHDLTQVSIPEQDQHLTELCEAYAVDLGKKVADEAMQIPDVQERYEFLRKAIQIPTLSARITQDNDFAEVVIATAEVVAPERIEQIRKRIQERPEDPVGFDLRVHPIPIVMREPVMAIPERP